jgi:hypothetical protein
VQAMVDRWAEDAAHDRDVILLAYRRESVEALNRAARKAWEEMGHLSGPELVAPGGRANRPGTASSSWPPALAERGSPPRPPPSLPLTPSCRQSSHHP